MKTVAFVTPVVRRDSRRSSKSSSSSSSSSSEDENENEKEQGKEDKKKKTVKIDEDIGKRTDQEDGRQVGAAPRQRRSAMCSVL